MIKRLIVAVMAVILISSGAVPAIAADKNDNPFRVVLEDAVYGGLVGTLLGAATLAFTRHKSDHLDNIAVGAALGVMGGTGVALYSKLNQSLVEYENGKIRLAMPSVKPDLLENGHGQKVLALKADLFRGNF